MTATSTLLLKQFVQESRDGLQEISTRLLALERQPADAALMDELFRVVHTLKGNCGLFEFPDMFRVLHAAEDLMSAVRDAQIGYDQDMADVLLQATDLMSAMFDEIESQGHSSDIHTQPASRLVAQLRQMSGAGSTRESSTVKSVQSSVDQAVVARMKEALALVPAAIRSQWSVDVVADKELLWIEYVPEPECFFKGEDPLYLAMQIPGLLWRRVVPSVAWQSLAQLDAYHCNLSFQAVVNADRRAVEEHFRYVSEQVWISTLPAAVPEVPDLTRVADALALVQLQREVLSSSEGGAWVPGRLKAAVSAIERCMQAIGRTNSLATLHTSAAEALAQASAAPVLAWIERQAMNASEDSTTPESNTALVSETEVQNNFGRRVEDHAGSRVLKVEQEKVDRLMNLIGEMVVARNGLPYLAARAENQYGERELGREIRTQHAVINRIVEEMQDAIMQVRMMPVSFVFQRFPRLVRDIARRIGKDVELVMEGESTEADKNVIEALADPLVHLVRNALDHGLESPQERRAQGKSETGRLVIGARQDADRVLIEVSDDGRGIDPAKVRQKAYARGLLDEEALESLSDRDAMNLIFMPGFSTAEEVTDLSGRGVGMDAVRSAIERLNGSVQLDSEPGRGTRLQLSLPLSMAVTNIMIVESAGVQYGVPMDTVVETVRVPAVEVHRIKQHSAAVLRGRIVPLLDLNELLQLGQPQKLNDHAELATLVLRIHGQYLGLVIDDFREVVEVILKPLNGILNGLTAYAGSALLGDGSVLMVINPKELVK